MRRGFTLVELLVVIAIIGVLAGLLLPALGRAKGAARKATCTSNVLQINLALLMYAEDHGDALRARTNEEPVYFSYRESIKPYLSRSGSSTNDVLFVCPADDFNCDEQPIKDLFAFDTISGRGFCHQAVTFHTSYFFNGKAPEKDATDVSDTRMAQKPFSSVREPARLLLAGEDSGGLSLSAHDRRQPYQFNNAQDVMSFVDGHVAYIRMYWNGVKGLAGISFLYEPRGGYDYKWVPE